MFPYHEEPLKITGVLKKLSGYTQSNLIQCDDGRLYVAKLYPNPLSLNSLANEAIGATLLYHLEIPSPSWRVLSVSSSDIARFPELQFIVVGGFSQPEPGIHFASQYLADPDHTIMDFPAPSLHVPVINFSKFLDIYLFDLWANHRDRRQFIYRIDQRGGLAKVFFIDNSHLFGNHTWGEAREGQQPDTNAWTKPLTASYDYRLSRRAQEFKRRIPEVLHRAIADTPPEWHGSDPCKLEAWLLRRLERLRDLVEENLAFHDRCFRLPKQKE